MRLRSAARSMFDDPNAVPTRIGFLLIRNFSMMAFTSAVEPLRSANRMSGRTLYDWRIISPDGQPVAASNGIEVARKSVVSGKSVSVRVYLGGRRTFQNKK